MKTATIYDVLTDAEIAEVGKLFDTLGPCHEFVLAIRDQFIVPNLARINAGLGQENDPGYLAFAVEFVFVQASKLAAKAPGN